MERIRIGFESGYPAPGQVLRGVVMLELPIDLLARRFDVLVQGVRRGEEVGADPGVATSVSEARTSFEIPLLLEVLHVPVGFSRRENGYIVMPQGLYFLRFTFRVPGKESMDGPPRSVSTSSASPSG